MARHGRPAIGNTAAPRSDKFRKYRASKRRQGLKLVRLWLPDPKSAGVRRRIRRQCLALRGTPADREALDFIEAIHDEERWWQ